MCEANVYILDELGNEELVLEMVDKVRPFENKIFLQNIFGQQKIITAQIKELALLEHKVLLEKVL